MRGDQMLEEPRVDLGEKRRGRDIGRCDGVLVSCEYALADGRDQIGHRRGRRVVAERLGFGNGCSTAMPRAEKAAGKSFVSQPRSNMSRRKRCLSAT
jgi:hypothetical protein